MNTYARRALWALAISLPLGVSGGLVYWKSGEDALLARATAQVERGELESALETLRPLPRRPLLSSEAHRRAAALFFRLGDDGVAHTLLNGQRFDDKDPEDQRLRDLGGRCLRAAQALKKADAARTADERLRILEPARVDLPDAPALLQRVVIEDLGALISARSESEAAQRSEHYLQDYAELRRKAPKMAAEVERRHQQLLNGTK